MNQGPPAYNALVNDEEIESRAPTQQPMVGQVQPTPGYPTFQQQGMILGVGQPATFYVRIMTNHKFNLSHVHVDATISTNYHALSQLCYTNT